MKGGEGEEGEGKEEAGDVCSALFEDALRMIEKNNASTWVLLLVTDAMVSLRRER